ncbi:MAG TPA: ABC transporter substrate-binding protein [Gaiellaceae bacterium]|nr:ABC transporter substrate-binding protein [Gaiellaceae bacterium]
MDRESRRRLEEFRREAGPIENNVIDELAEGELSRSDFIKRASMFGLSASVIGSALAALGEAPLAFARPEAVKAGGRLRLGIIPPPTHPIEPILFFDQGSLETGGICGEFLNRTTLSGGLNKELATSWNPNKNATVWTYKLRPNVKFQNGTTMNADDVVATYKTLTGDPSSEALAAFKGVLSPDGVVKVDNETVAFHLDSPTAAFPYLTSSTTYQAIILPSTYQKGSFVKTAETTGAFKLTQFTPGIGAKYDRFTGWWGGHAPLDGVDVTYYSDDAAVAAALLGNSIDLIGQIQFATGRPLFGNKNVQIFRARGATHREVCMRVDLNNQLHDYRVRQAIAYTLDRPAIRKTLFNNLADLGNDNPFAPAFASTDKSVPQRHKDIRKAKQLMAAAGHSKGFSLTLTTEQVGEIPQLAQIIQRSVRQIGIKMTLRILTETAYFAGSQTGPPSGWGTTPWLNTPMNITDWGSRAVVNQLLIAAFESKGVWNAAHYSNKKVDRLSKSFLGAISITDQHKYSKQIELQLLHDTPVIIPYFYNYLAAGSKKVKGYKADALGQIYLSHTSLS